MVTWRVTTVLLVAATYAIGCGEIIGANWNVTVKAASPEAGLVLHLPDASKKEADAPHDAHGDAASFPFTAIAGNPGGQTLNAIFGWDESDFVAVGTGEIAYVYSGGLLQSTGGTTAGYDLYGVWGASPTDVYAVGVVASNNTGFIQHFDGTEWTTVFESPTALFGVWGDLTPNGPGVLAVGDQGVIYGLPPDEMGGWQTVLSVPESPGAPDAGPFSPVLTSITGGNGSITVTAEGDQFFQWLPGASGDYYYEPQGDPRTNFAASWQPALATGATDVYLGSNFFGFYWITSTYVGPLDGSTATTVGPDGGATLYQLYGDQVPGGEELAILGIWGTASKVVAVGDLGKVLLFDVLSGNLSVLPSGTQQSFGGVWGSDLEHVWIVGANELILQGSLAGL